MTNLLNVVMILPIVIMFFMIIIIAIIIGLTISRMNVQLSKHIDGHSIQVCTGIYYAKLLVDGKVVDEINSYHIYTAKLVGRIEAKNIVVNIGTGFMGRRVTTFVNEEKVIELCN